MLFQLLIASSVLFGQSVAGGGYSCSNGQVYMGCGSACNITCDDRDTNFLVPCTLQCVERCQCPSATPVQDIDIDGNIRCITGDQCCPEGKVWDECASACPPTCNEGPQICTQQCVQKCSCPRDKPIELDDGTCISEDECPPECPGDLVWNSCGSACNSTCDEPNPICTLQCVPRCECPFDAPIQDVTYDGQLRCIKEEQCCPGKQVWNECASPCPPECFGLPKPCPAICLQKCTCPKDRPILQKGKCIKEKQCKCKLDKKWTISEVDGKKCEDKKGRPCKCKNLKKSMLRKVCKQDIEGGRTACCKLCKKKGFL